MAMATVTEKKMMSKGQEYRLEKQRSAGMPHDIRMTFCRKADYKNEREEAKLDGNFTGVCRKI